MSSKLEPIAPKTLTHIETRNWLPPEPSPSDGPRTISPLELPRPANRYSGQSAKVRSSISPLEQIEVLFRHKLLIGLSLVTAIMLAWIAILAWPRSYESESKLLIRIGHESVGLDPSVIASRSVAMEKTLEEEVNSALEILSSRQLAERVVDAIGAQSILAGALPTQETVPQPATEGWLEGFTGIAESARATLHSVLLSSGVRDDISHRELAVREILGAVRISAPRASAVISISAFSETPEMAQAIARTYTEEYLEQRLMVTHTAGSYDFFLQQSQAAEKRLEQELINRSDFMQQHNLVSIEANLKLLTEELSFIEQDTLKALSGLEKSRAEMQDLKSRVEQSPGEIVSNREEVFDETWSGMRQLVYELELQEKNLASKFTDDYPALAQVREQLTGAREILEELQSDRINLSTTPNPERIRLAAGLQQLETEVAGLQAILNRKESQKEELNTRVNALHELERQLKQKDRNISLMEANLLMLRQKLEESKLIEDMLTTRISSANVLQPATFVERAVHPNKKILAATLSLLGLMGGVLLAFIRESNLTTLRTERHVETALDTPVIARIPYTSRLKGRNRATDLARLRSGKQHLSEVVSRLLLSYRRLADGNRGVTVGVVGLDDNAGASTTAITLALACSEDFGIRTTLIDADGRRRTVAKAFGLVGVPGLAELAAGDATHADCVQRLEGSTLGLIASSSQSGDSIEQSPQSWRAAIDRFQEESDLVIIDLPSAARADQMLRLAEGFDFLVFVIESEGSSRAAAIRVVQQFEECNSQVMGCVLNKQRRYVPAWFSGILGIRS